MAQNDIELTLLRELAGHLALPIWVTGSDGQLLYYNAAAEAILGQPFEETRGVSVSGEALATMFQVTAEDGSPLQAEALPMNIALTEREPAHLRMRIRGLDEVWRMLEVTAFPIEGQGGRFLGVAAIFWQVE